MTDRDLGRDLRADIGIRSATPADAEAIAAHRYSADTDIAERPIYAEWVRGVLGHGNYVGFFAEQGSEIVAGAGLVLLDWGPSRGNPNPLRARLVNVWTHESYRRQGLARQLVELLLTEARARSIGIVSLSSTEMGRALYERMGFEAFHHEMLYKLGEA